MSLTKFADYFSNPVIIEEYKNFLIGRLIAEYAERGEQMPRFNFNNGKLDTDSQELRLKYRYMLQGVQSVAVFLDHARNQKQAAAEQQQQQS